uniref:Uncharacterized protein n=1 Tax=Fundulus heteroclitus TaxID=8078 RepID=A0A3Q2P0U3_FUNHE
EEDGRTDGPLNGWQLERKIKVASRNEKVPPKPQQIKSIRPPGGSLTLLTLPTCFFGLNRNILELLSQCLLEADEEFEERAKD